MQVGRRATDHGFEGSQRDNGRECGDVESDATGDASFTGRGKSFVRQPRAVHGPLVLCCTPARSSRATRRPSFLVSRISPPSSGPTRSSSHYPPTPQLHHSPHSSPRSPPSPCQAALAVSPQLRTPARPLRARWHSSVKIMLRSSTVIYLGGQRRR